MNASNKNPLEGISHFSSNKEHSTKRRTVREYSSPLLDEIKANEESDIIKDLRTRTDGDGFS